MNSDQEQKYMQILNHAEQLRNELRTMPIAVETDVLFIGAVDMLNESQAAYQLQQKRIDAVIETLKSDMEVAKLCGNDALEMLCHKTITALNQIKGETPCSK